MFHLRNVSSEWRCVADPPKMEFINGSGKVFNTVHSSDFKFYKELHAVVDREPIEFIDPQVRGIFASIGIQKGKSFSPDERMKKLLTRAADAASELDARRAEHGFALTVGEARAAECHECPTSVARPCAHERAVDGEHNGEPWRGPSIAVYSITAGYDRESIRRSC